MDFREYDSMSYLLDQLPKRAQRGFISTNIEWSCVDASKDLIVLGSNISLAYVYDRKSNHLTKLKFEDKQSSATCIKLQSSLDHQVAVGTSNGHVEMFLLPARMHHSHVKEPKKITLKNLHKGSVTCAEWSTNGMKLFTGDGMGKVAYTEVDFYENVTNSTIIVRETDPIVQLSYAHRALLVSTFSRSVICYTNEDYRLQQVGQKPRKVNGNFGGHFIPAMCKPSNATMYIARPGLRLWRASMNGSVLETLLFRDSFSPNISTMELLSATKVPLLGQESDPQFGRVRVLNDSVVVIFSHSTLFVVTPQGDSGASILCSCHGLLGSILNIAITDDEIFVLRRGTERPLVRLGIHPDQRNDKDPKFVPDQDKNYLQGLINPTSVPDSPVTKKKSDVLLGSLTSVKNAFKKAADEFTDGALKAKEDFESLLMAAKPERESDIPFKPQHQDEKDGDVERKIGTVEIAPPETPTPEAVPSGSLLNVGFRNEPIGTTQGEVENMLNKEDGFTNEMSAISVPEKPMEEEPEQKSVAPEVELAERGLDLERLNQMGQEEFDDIVFQQKPKKKKKKKSLKENAPGLKTDLSSSASLVLPDSEVSSSSQLPSNKINGIYNHKDNITINDGNCAHLFNNKDSLPAEVAINLETPSSDSHIPQSLSFDYSMEPPDSFVESHDIPSDLSYTPGKPPDLLTPTSAGSQLHRLGVQFERMHPSDQPMPLKSYELTPQLDSLGSSVPLESISSTPEMDYVMSDELNDDVSDDQNVESEEEQGAEFCENTLQSISSFDEDIYTKYGSTGSFEMIKGTKSSPEHPLLNEDVDSDSDTESHENNESDEQSLEEFVFFENIQQKLAGSWMQCTSPGYVTQLVASEKHLWCVDSKQKVFFSHTSKVACAWNRLKGVLAKQISVSPSGNIVWRVDKNSNIAYASSPITSRVKVGSRWNKACKDVEFVCLDETMAWIIKRTGEVCIQAKIKRESPITKTQQVESNFQVTEIAANRGVVWARTVDNRVVYRTDISIQRPQGKRWSEFEKDGDVRAVSIALDNKCMGWAIDKEGRLWFRMGVCLDHPQGDDNRWWQVTMSEYLMEDRHVLKMMVNMAGNATKVDRFYSWLKKQAYETTQVAANSSGVWVCGAYQFKTTLQVSRGNLLGSCWETASPVGLPSTCHWISISAQAVYGPSGLIWAVQKSGEVCSFPPTTRKPIFVAPPERTRFVLLSASTDVIWALSEKGTIYLRTGFSCHCPQGTEWKLLDVSQQLGSSKIVHLSCGSDVVWAVDSNGSCYIRVGTDLPRNEGLPRAWLPVDGKPSGYNTFFTHVYCGSSDSMVWAIDNKKAVYVRKSVTKELPVGTEWELVEGTQANELCISSDTVWALVPNGDIACRYGTSEKNPVGDYWKKVPGNFAHLSATQNNDLWALKSDGTLFQRFVKVFKRQDVDSPLTADAEGLDDEEWELL